ncbi:MAG: hypothetical protein PQJ60_07785 [Spirochaetales bacterium]|nr:hypothetical protein [Spirochaetales bacterium]
MIGFLIKKSFWDYWDRMGLMILMNLVIMLVGGVAVYGSITLAEMGLTIPAGACLILLGALFFLILGANSRLCSEVVYYRSLYIKNWFSYFKEKAPKMIFFYLMILALSFVIITSLQFYGNSAGGPLFLGAFFLTFWVTLLLIFTAGYYLPLSNIMKDPFKKNLKKCFILFFDNPGISVVVSLLSFFLFALSLVTAFLLPGISAVAVLWENLMKLLMFKYDYLEENPEADRKKIPWDVLLKEERETVGDRTLGNMLRPWK